MLRTRGAPSFMCFLGLFCFCVGDYMFWTVGQKEVDAACYNFYFHLEFHFVFEYILVFWLQSFLRVPTWNSCVDKFSDCSVFNWLYQYRSPCIRKWMNPECSRLILIIIMSDRTAASPLLPTRWPSTALNSINSYIIFPTPPLPPSYMPSWTIKIEISMRNCRMRGNFGFLK